MKGEAKAQVVRVPTVAFVSVSNLVVGRSLSELIRNGRLTYDCTLRFADHQRTVHVAALIVEERKEETPRGIKRVLDVKLLDRTTQTHFANEEEWATDCLRRKCKKLAFIVWDKIHAWTSDDQDLGSLNDLRRISPHSEDCESAPAKSLGRRRVAAKDPEHEHNEASLGLGEESDEDDEGEWHTLDQIMKGEEEEVDVDAVEAGEQGEAEAGELAAAGDGEVTSEGHQGTETTDVVGGGVVEAGSDWAAINGNEVRVFGRPFLGFGAFATVKRGEWMGIPVAIKSINKLKKGQYARGVQRELQMWWPARHPHIVSLYGALESESHIFIVMERLHINLSQAVERFSRRLVLEHCKRWATQIASAMHFLHSRGVIHRDLKLGNILLTKDFKSCKIADFGTAVKESEADNIHVGTTEYMAPELHVRSPHSTKMDVYSFGILLWKLFNPYTYPYPKHDPVSYGGGKRHRLHLLRVVHEGARPQMSKAFVPPAWRELMEDCWAADPNARPTFDEVVRRLKDLPAPS